MRDFGVNNLIFSSSCSVYRAIESPTRERDHAAGAAAMPVCPHESDGRRDFQDYCQAHPEFKAIVLRYFNPAGAHSSALIGEHPRNVATNLVPVITETAIGKRPVMQVFLEKTTPRATAAACAITYT